ncbi:lipid droplet phospholipase 1-like isoform X2 [Cornus florida]|uniref:lipid droplet phospholipase 1-like isoform X2 n=1 Tax=Cornus florida TaxID=4283 RepID=UPI002899BBF5|nr:lipid droplet phospholipase 1-like isoform X2 [Cornus florida]
MFMDSTELQSSNTVEEMREKKSEMDLAKNKKRYSYMPKFGCLRADFEYPTVERSDGDDMESGCTEKDRSPTHLVIMVNGIFGSAQDWRFAAQQFLKRYPQDVIVHRSECNSSMLTIDGVDVMGKRLADEVISVITGYPNLQKISFIGHSLGGLVARYAIAKLYDQDIQGKASQGNVECRSNESNDPCSEEKLIDSEGKLIDKIAGLVPMNFITVATPHLGSRGHKQVPVCCGFYTMEKVASRASWLLARTGKHLFLTDGDKRKPPLLLQMVNDTDDLKFISALKSFKRRVAYANANFDHIVGWSTSSIRRRSELPKRQRLSRNDKYPHIVNEELAITANPQQELSLEIIKVNGYKTIDMEEAMIRSLTKLSWERVDVSFRGSKQRFFAHGKYLLRQF